MKVGFFLEWMVGSLDKSNKWNVVGEELLSMGWAKELMKLDSNIEADIYSYNKQPKEHLDVMIYMNYNTKVIESWATTNIMYLENDFGDDGNLNKIYDILKKNKIDAMLTYSEKSIEFLKEKGYKTYYFPFSVDTDIYKPTEYFKEFDYDIAYVGSNIKNPRKTKKFFKPALKFNFGLFGNWNTQIPSFITPKKIFSNLKNFDIYSLCSLFRYSVLRNRHNFNIVLSEVSKGKIPQEDMMKLLSSSKIALNMTLPGNIALDIINYRIMEVFACKGFVISDYCPIIEKYFKDAVVFSGGGRDLEKKIKYYLAHPEIRKEKGEAGYKIVQELFTSKMRAKELYDIIMETI